MSDQNESKLNRLLAGLSDTGVVSSRRFAPQAPELSTRHSLFESEEDI